MCCSGTLVAPPFDNILASTTLRRAFELAPSLPASVLPGGATQRAVSLEEVTEKQPFLATLLCFVTIVCQDRLGTDVRRALKTSRNERFAQAKSGATTEMIDFGGGFSKPILTFDGAAVGEGKAGPVRFLLDSTVAFCPESVFVLSLCG